MTTFLIILYFVVGYVITKVIDGRTSIFSNYIEGDLFFGLSIIFWPVIWPLRFIILNIVARFTNFLVELINELLDKLKK